MFRANKNEGPEVTLALPFLHNNHQKISPETLEAKMSCKRIQCFLSGKINLVSLGQDNEVKTFVWSFLSGQDNGPRKTKTFRSRMQRLSRRLARIKTGALSPNALGKLRPNSFKGCQLPRFHPLSLRQKPRGYRKKQNALPEEQQMSPETSHHADVDINLGDLVQQAEHVDTVEPTERTQFIVHCE